MSPREKFYTTLFNEFLLRQDIYKYHYHIMQFTEEVLLAHGADIW